MALKDKLTGIERDELSNIMLNEPLPRARIRFACAAISLERKGLVYLVREAWYVDWYRVRLGWIIGE